MKGYIKDIHTFKTIGAYDVESYTLAWGDSGKAVLILSGEDNVTVQNVFTRNWIIIDSNIFLLSECTADHERMSCTLTDPAKAFDRMVSMSSYSGTMAYGPLIKWLLQHDTEYGSFPYLQIGDFANVDYCNDNKDAGGRARIYTYMQSAREAGGSLAFEVLSNGLKLSLGLVPAAQNVVPEDGHTQLDEESYSRSVYNHIVIGVKSEDETSVTYHDYYLQSDGSYSTSQPSEYITGSEAYEIIDYGDDPDAEMKKLAQDNDNSHKITFYSDLKLTQYQYVNIRIRGAIYKTKITDIYRYSTDSRYFYKCGQLSTTLTEKIKKLEG